MFAHGAPHNAFCRMERGELTLSQVNTTAHLKILTKTQSVKLKLECVICTYNIICNSVPRGVSVSSLVSQFSYCKPCGDTWKRSSIQPFSHMVHVTVQVSHNIHHLQYEVHTPSASKQAFPITSDSCLHKAGEQGSLVPRPSPVFVLWFAFSIIQGSGRVYILNTN